MEEGTQDAAETERFVGTPLGQGMERNDISSLAILK